MTDYISQAQNSGGGRLKYCAICLLTKFDGYAIIEMAWRVGCTRHAIISY